MRTHTKLLGLAVLAIAAIVIYLDWTRDRRSGPLLSDLRTLPISIQGQPGTAGNLLGIETRLVPADYQSRERLQLKFATYLDQARDAGLLNARTVVVLPEHVGTGLFALGEKPEVQQARTLRDAMQWMALSNPWDYLRALFNNEGDDRRTEAALKIKARQMADDYQLIFGGLARDYGVTLVAGSIVLPEPRLEDGRLLIGDGPLRQVSLSFAASGEPIGPLQHKMMLSRYEQRYSEASTDQPGTLLQTPAGRLTVLIGCDGYTRSVPADAELLAVPGARDDPSSACAATAPTGTELPRMEVRTLGLPWNLVGSPHRPTRHNHSEPVQLNNLWLPERS
ncbi:carbon-nitrogen hydrolase [Stutzerimonas sp. VN223-3]|uniref:carbon-nitrogen hydrolase n=1 Tax=Stutzerimonas sp. VN223-3 TaxID=3384601 RepID=UPI0038B5AAD5